MYAHTVPAYSLGDAIPGALSWWRRAFHMVWDTMAGHVNTATGEKRSRRLADARCSSLAPAAPAHLCTITLGAGRMGEWERGGRGSASAHVSNRRQMTELL